MINTQLANKSPQMSTFEHKSSSGKEYKYTGKDKAARNAVMKKAGIEVSKKEYKPPAKESASSGKDKPLNTLTFPPAW